jgi:hypothetical protein
VSRSRRNTDFVTASGVPEDRDLCPLVDLEHASASKQCVIIANQMYIYRPI